MLGAVLQGRVHASRAGRQREGVPRGISRVRRSEEPALFERHGGRPRGWRVRQGIRVQEPKRAEHLRERGIVQRVTRPQSEGALQVVQVRERAGFFPEDIFGVLELEGSEAASFLDAQLPVRVLDLAPDQGAHTAYLDAKGRVTHDLLLLRIAERRFWMLARVGDLESLAAKLETYHIREAITIQNRASNLAVWEVHGPRVPEILARTSGAKLPPDAYAHAELMLDGVPARFVVHPWSGDPG